jgi:hypothetical protein
MAEQGRQEGDNDMTAAGRQEAPKLTENRGHDPGGGTAASFVIPVSLVKQTVCMPFSSRKKWKQCATFPFQTARYSLLKEAR